MPTVLFIERTAGLTRVNGAAYGTPANGSLTVVDATAGNITITVDETVTKLLSGTTPWTVKMLDSSANTKMLATGVFVITKYGVEPTQCSISQESRNARKLLGVLGSDAAQGSTSPRENRRPAHSSSSRQRRRCFFSAHGFFEVENRADNKRAADKNSADNKRKHPGDEH